MDCPAKVVYVLATLHIGHWTIHTAHCKQYIHGQHHLQLRNLFGSARSFTTTVMIHSFLLMVMRNGPSWRICSFAEWQVGEILSKRFFFLKLNKSLTRWRWFTRWRTLLNKRQQSQGHSDKNQPQTYHFCCILVCRCATYRVPAREVKLTEMFHEVTHGQLFPNGSSLLIVM